MAGTSDEEMEKLLKLADEISGDFIIGITEIETLKSNYSAEISNRQSIELTCNILKQENERLKSLHHETLNNLLLQLQQRGNSSNLKEELRKLNEEITRKDEDHRIAVDLMKKNYEAEIRVSEGKIGDCLRQKREELMRLNERFLKKEEVHRNSVDLMRKNYEAKIRDLEGRIGEIARRKREDESTVFQLHHELISTRKKSKEMEGKLMEEVEDLKDCVSMEQQEKEELSKKVRELEKELLVTRTRVADQHVSTSDKQLELMKQKMMKLRRENEVLKRQVNASKEDFSMTE